MIKFSTTSDKKLKVEVESGILRKIFFLYWDCGDDVYAELLRQQFHVKLNETLSKIRRDSYEKGWKDAKAKVKKQTWFSGWW